MRMSALALGWAIGCALRGRYQDALTAGLCAFLFAVTVPQL